MKIEHNRNGLDYSIKILKEAGLEYEYEMILHNKIPYLMSMELLYEEEETYLQYYRKESVGLDTILKKASMRFEQLYAMIEGIFCCMKELEAYMLSVDNLIISPDEIYIKGNENTPEFIYFPGYQKDIIKQLKELLEYMMEHIDYQEERTVAFLYGLYRILQLPECNQVHIQKFLEENKKISKEKRPEKNMDRIQNEYDQMWEKKEEYSFEKQEKIQQGKKEEKQEKNRKKTVAAVFFFLLQLISAIFVGIMAWTIWKQGITIERRNRLIVYSIVFVFSLTACIKMLLQNKNNKKMQVVFEENKKEKYRNLKDDHVEEREFGRNLYAEEETMCLSSDAYTDLEGTALLSTPLRRSKLEGRDGTVYEIPSYPYMIGSGEQADARISQKGISRIHARLEQSGDAVYLIDCGSTNGTFVNHMPLQPNTKMQIVNGDHIRMACYDYIFEDNLS